MNQAQMMAQVRKMQQEMAKAQEELASLTVSGTAGGGLVAVEMTCDYRVKSVKLGKEAVDPEDLETLEDLLVVAVNDAVVKAQDALKQLEALSQTGYVSPRSRTFIYCGLEDWDRVLEELAQACSDHCPWLTALKVDPRFDRIRADRRFIGLLQRMNLA